MSLRNLFAIHFLLLTLCAFGQDSVQFIKGNHYRYRSSTAKVDGKLKNGKPHDKWVTRYKDYTGKWYIGEIKNYWSGELNGLYVSFDFQGDTTSAGNYHKGKRVGEWRFYDDHLITHSTNYNAQGQPQGWCYTYRRDGTFENKMYYTDSVSFYLWNYYFDGVLAERGQYSAGGKTGTWYSYLPLVGRKLDADTMPIAVEQWKEGNRNGVGYYYEHGVLMSEKNYHNGRYNGAVIEYANGKIRSENYFVDGSAEGSSRSYTDSGIVYAEVRYHQSKVIYRGEFDPVTGIVKEENWFSGSLPDSSRQYYPNGKLMMQRALIRRDSSLYCTTCFYENGNKKDSCALIGYSETGVYKSWYENGKRKEVANYRNGQHTRCDIWNESGVHVFHADASRGRDTLPEIVWDDRGRKLVYGSAAYLAQREKYAPGSLTFYVENEFYLNAIVVTKKMPERNYPYTSHGQAVYLDGRDSTSSNKRTPPRFPGGLTMESRYMSANLRYPAMEYESGISGSSWIQFRVGTDGTIDSCILVRSSSAGLDREALRVIKQMPHWEPATKNGKVMEAYCVVEVKWKLE